MARRLGGALALMALVAAAIAAEPTPAVDPRSPGAQLPAHGRSLFDFVFAQDGKYVIPFPFKSLLARIERLCGSRTRGRCVNAVLIPIGRSLQRTAAAPDYFRYPRVVVAVTGEPDAREGHTAILLKDRLYLGYQEKAGVIEVISYNEEAGRFEFQVVRDYRAGATPRVLYANRMMCTACHQNQGPIFPRAAWDETNANPKVAAMLARTGWEIHGVAVDRGVDIPNAIDDATDRAAYLPAYQLLWRDGCPGEADGTRCRAALFRAALQYRLSDAGAFERDESFTRDFASPFAARWRERWPAGLSIASPDIPNRDPLAGRTPDVPARFDPLQLRAPVETWADGGPETQRRLVEGLAGFIAESDVRVLDNALFQRAIASTAQRHTHRARCRVARGPAATALMCASDDSALRLSASLRAEASGRVRGDLRIYALEGEQGLGEIALASAEARAGETVVRFTPLRRGRHVRLRDGNAIERIDLHLRRESGEAVVTILGDFAPVSTAIDEMERRMARGESDVFAEGPFRRAAAMEEIFSRLGLKNRRACCLDARALPTARAEEAGGERGATPHLKVLYQYCGTCHLGPDRFPPNFLQGDAQRVHANVEQCAERLYFRLAMWRQPPQARAKTPMPPPAALETLAVHPAQWGRSAELVALEGFASGLLRSRGSDPSTLLAREYETLRPCIETN